MPAPYDYKIKATAKVIFMEGHTVEQVSEKLRGVDGKGPGKSAVQKWARVKETQPDKREMDWYAQRDEIQKALYERLSPKGRVRKLEEKFDQVLQMNVLQEPGKFADAVKKISATMVDITDPSMNLPVILGVVEDLLSRADQAADAPDCCREFFANTLEKYWESVKARVEGI